MDARDFAEVEDQVRFLAGAFKLASLFRMECQSSHSLRTRASPKQRHAGSGIRRLILFEIRRGE